MDSKLPIVFLMGPTASGKTQLAMALIRLLPLEIISVDSAMIYCGMNIGTGKPTDVALKQAPHHLINMCDPKETYSAADFCRDARAAIQAIHQRQKIPLLVGGTMMYFNALKYGLAPLPEADENTRQQLQKEKESFGLEKLHRQLREVDPQSAQRIHPNDPQRLLRALEVYRLTGKPMSTFFTNALPITEAYRLIELAISPKERHRLHERIENRFSEMLEAGFVNEVKTLHDRGDLDLQKPSMRCVGYRQIWRYLEGEYDYQTMVAKANAATRQLAKRQLTWLRAWRDCHWFDSEDKALLKKVTDFLSINL